MAEVVAFMVVGSMAEGSMVVAFTGAVVGSTGAVVVANFRGRGKVKSGCSSEGSRCFLGCDPA
ncbi:MAG: hypothetical protein ACP5E5_14970 [Acidobacteriaceae bacterium]